MTFLYVSWVVVINPLKIIMIESASNDSKKYKSLLVSKYVEKNLIKSVITRKKRKNKSDKVL